jgi:hypothetical protein
VLDEAPGSLGSGQAARRIGPQRRRDGVGLGQPGCGDDVHLIILPREGTRPGSLDRAVSAGR